jgi:hypothetical protein
MQISSKLLNRYMTNDVESIDYARVVSMTGGLPGPVAKLSPNPIGARFESLSLRSLVLSRFN